MMHDIRTIARALGGDVTGRDSCNVPGPGHGPKDRSLSIKLNARAPGGFVVFSHAGDDPIACRDYIRGRLGLAAWAGRHERTPLVVTSAGPDHDREQRRLAALRIWRQAVPPIGTIVERYLREHRGLHLQPDDAGRVIRFHGSLHFDGKRLPGMVCLLRDIVTDEPCGIHRTFLDRETAAKIDRRMLGIAKGAAIKLDPQEAISDYGIVVIGEGIETVLAGREMGFGPAWALGSSSAIAAFPVLKDVWSIAIFQENDAASRGAVRTCSRRWLKAGRPVEVVTPQVGNDLNDAWRMTQVRA